MQPDEPSTDGPRAIAMPTGWRAVSTAIGGIILIAAMLVTPSASAVVTILRVAGCVVGACAVLLALVGVLRAKNGR